jgi:choline dehydrogenase
MNARDEQRVTTNDAYLEPARSRPNLTIIGNTLVDQVEFNGRRACGVRARTISGWQSISGREVFLCAGTIHSPAILLRSGIGPADELRQTDIAPVLNLPGVGQNLAEHPLISLGVDLRPEAHAASAHVRQSMCVVRYSSTLAGSGRNDMKIASTQPTGVDEGAPVRGAIGVSALQTFSRGRIWLTSADPAVDPAVDFRLLTDERDMVRMRDGVRRLFDLVRHPAIANIATRIRIDNDGRGPDDIRDDSDLDEWLLATCSDYVHSVGTCRMGSVDDSRAVVDPRGRVIGVEGLRVVDASIMPEAPRANTHLTTVMIAERIAESVRGESR